VQLLLKEQLCMTQILQAVKSAPFVLLGPFQRHRVKQIGLQISFMYWALILISDFVLIAMA
jgi:hypothetical protein